MDQKPLITFIIPVYNIPEPMVRECIDSILALSMDDSDREIIVIDDGSDTPAETMLYRYPVTCIRQDNGGLSRARNTGLRHANGQYIQLVDADDKLLKPAYDHCITLARQQQPDIILFDFTRQVGTSSCWHDAQPVTGTQLMTRHNIQASACGYLFKATLPGTLTFTPGIYHEDEEFTPLLLLKAETVVKTDAKAYFYRPREQSITTDHHTQAVAKRLEDHREIILRLHERAVALPDAQRKALLRRTHQLTMDFVYKVMMEIGNRQQQESQLAILQETGLFPLPPYDYTSKYKWFRRISSLRIGRAVLAQLLPLIKRER